ncbi:MAG: hypothetical protein RBR86_05035 [Pseudobdellovibrionaceae bacterium]|jgi:phosphoglycolate phosphatase-like HAD superfamily hydrolase|nr:hypothetical protein [Pseudobdellovibrionaceae bacterium]
MTALKRLVILDLDNTLFDALGRWASCTRALVQDFAAANNLAPDTIHKLIKEAHGQHRFNDGAALVDAMIEADPAIIEGQKNLSAEWQLANRRVASNWHENSSNMVWMYDGVIDSLKYWKKNGVKIIIETDCEVVAVHRNLYLLGKEAERRGQLEKAAHIAPLIDEIYCQPAIAESSIYFTDVDSGVRDILSAKTHIWDDRHYKPHADHVATILERANIPAGQAIYIGDSYKDGAEAASIFPQIDFIWAKYGAAVTSDTLDLYECVGSKSFTYGEDSVMAAMQERGIHPYITLLTGLHDVLPHFTWGSRVTQVSEINPPRN